MPDNASVTNTPRDVVVSVTLQTLEWTSRFNVSVPWWENGEEADDNPSVGVFGRRSRVPIYGLPGSLFYVIHITAVVSLTISILTSCGVLIYSLGWNSIPVWRRPIGERLVVYLAVMDLLFSVSHEIDHVYMLVHKDFPPDILCQICGFFLQEFTIAQDIIITFAAFSAFVMVVKERKIPLGRYDWRLFAVAFGMPFILVTTEAGLGYLGPGGPWCLVDLSKPYGPMLGNIISMAIIATFVVNLICYLLVWVKIQQISRSMANMDARAAENSRKYQRSARIMMLFVAVFIAQWWAYTTFAAWTFYGDPHISISVAAVLFSNMGGVFNFIAYTFVRRVWQEQSKTKSENSVTGTSTVSN